MATPGCTTQPSPPLRPLEEALNVNMSIPDALASAGDFIHRSQVNYVNLVTALENLSVKGNYIPLLGFTGSKGLKCKLLRAILFKFAENVLLFHPNTEKKRFIKKLCFVSLQIFCL